MNKQQLANRIWASANSMRSKIAANEYKDYILGLIFYKFISDTEVKYFTQDCGWQEEELVDLVEDYKDDDMKKAIEECQNKIGFFITYEHLFSTWLVKNANFDVATLSAALGNFDRLLNPNFASVYGGIFKTLREGLSKLGDNPAAQTKALRKLIDLIKDIPTDGTQDYDVLGYVYEFLISNFAASAGKKAGEFYTPHEVAMVMSEIVAEHHQDKTELEIYDPTSGSGSLLITIGKAVSKHIAGRNKVKYYAQELIESTYNLTRMNLVMRGIIPDNIKARCADSLDEDWPLEEKDNDIAKPLAVDAVVSNPPYSQHWDPKDKETDVALPSMVSRRKRRPTMPSSSTNSIISSPMASSPSSFPTACSSVVRPHAFVRPTALSCLPTSVKMDRLKDRFAPNSLRRTTSTPSSACRPTSSSERASPRSSWS